MAITTFTAAQVLTAAQMNAVQGNDYNQTVSTKTASYTLVAADKGTRVVMNVASANTVTVNTSLFSAGDTLVIQNIGAGVSTVTAGTATVSSAGPLAIPQYGSGTLYFTSAGVAIFFPSAGAAASSPGLVCVKAETAFSASSSITADSVFTSSYTNYLVNINYLTSTNQQVRMKLRIGGASTSANYSFERFFMNNTSLTGGITSATTSWYLGNDTNAYNTSAIRLELYAPQLAQSTAIMSYNMSNNDGAASIGVQQTFGNQTDSTQFDGIEILPASGTMTGTYTIYGYSKTV